MKTFYKEIILKLLLILSILVCSLSLCNQNGGYAYIRSKWAGVQVIVCVKSYEAIEGCMLYSSSTTIYPYDIVHRSQLTCLTYSDPTPNGDCTYVRLVDGSDYCIDKSSWISGCSLYKQSASGFLCYGCYWPYKVAENFKSCIVDYISTRIYNCQKYDSNNKCLFCDLNYTKIGYSCIPTQRINCQKFNQNTLKCDQCMYGYDYTGNSCKQNKSQIEGQLILPNCLQNEFLAQNNKCSKIIAHCKQYNLNGSCILCQDSYQFSDDFSECLYKKPISFGDQYEFCEKPKQGEDQGLMYLMVEGDCVGIDKYCAFGKFFKTGCYQCNDTAFLINFRCIQLPPDIFF